MNQQQRSVHVYECTAIQLRQHILTKHFIQLFYIRVADDALMYTKKFQVLLII